MVCVIRTSCKEFVKDEQRVASWVASDLLVVEVILTYYYQS